MELKTLACLLLTTCAHNLYATNGTFELYGEPEKSTFIPRFEIVVSYDDTSVTLKSEETLYNAYVVIKDFDGNVIYNGWTVIDNNGNTITMPVEEGTEKYTIEVYKDEECAKGYFE